MADSWIKESVDIKNSLVELSKIQRNVNATQRKINSIQSKRLDSLEILLFEMEKKSDNYERETLESRIKIKRVKK